MDKAFHGSNLIKGILREIAVLGVPVHLTSEQNHETQLAQLLIVGDQTRNKTDKDYVSFDPLPNPTTPTIEIQFELDGQLLSGRLEKHPERQDWYCLPEALSSHQRRRTQRVTGNEWSREPLVAEVRASGLRLYGEVKDGDRNHLLIRTFENSSYLIPGDLVQIRIYSANSQTLSANAKIKFLRKKSLGETELVLELGESPQPSSRPRAKRWNPESAAQVEIQWPGPDGLRVTLSILNLAHSGFAASVKDGTELPPLGAICSLSNLDISARLVWRSANEVGFDVRDNTQSGLSRWSDQAELWANAGLSRQAYVRQRAQILKIMLRSGYLRGKKAQVFKTPDLDLLIPNSPDTRTWLARFSRSKTGSLPDSHISYLRLSDTSWMIQELGHSASGIDGAKTIQDSFLQFFSREVSTCTLDSHLVAIYDDSSRFNREFWTARVNKGFGTYSKCIIADLSTLRSTKRKAEDRTLSVQRPTYENWRASYTELTSLFPEEHLRAIGLTPATFDSIHLRQLTAFSGYPLDRRISLISQNDRLCAVATNFGLPTFANLSATANHLWLLVDRIERVRPVLDLLFSVEEHSQVHCGSTEVVAVSATPFEKPEIDGLTSRSFSLFVVPILNLPQLAEAIE